MAHLVETMSFVGELPWHGLGTKVSEELTAQNMMLPAGLWWTAELTPMYLKDGTQVKDFNAVVRSTDLSLLGVVGKQWTPIQNQTMAEVADAIAGEGNAYCHTAGSLKKGKLVWFLLKLPQTLRLSKDPSEIDQYLLLSNAHDGSRALQVMFTPIRVVCNNTLNFALKTSKGICIRHTQTVEARLMEAAKALEKVNEISARFHKLAEALTLVQYKQEWIKKLGEVVIPMPPQIKKPDTNPKDLLAEIIDNTRAHQIPEEFISESILASRQRLEHLINFGTGITEDMRGTAWAATQGVVEYLDHQRNYRQAETRADSIMFGDAAYKKTKALELIVEQTHLQALVR